MPAKFHQQLITFMVLINEKITKQMENLHKDVLTPTQFLVVATIMNYGSMTMSVLASKINIQKQHATKIVNQLVEMKFVLRVADQKDRRIIRVELTDMAREFMYDNFYESMKAAISHFAVLNETEFMELQSAIEVLNRILPHISIEKKQPQ